MIVLIDNGHGVETPGKRSPDGRLREYAWTREVAQRIVGELRRRGIDGQSCNATARLLAGAHGQPRRNFGLIRVFSILHI